MINLESLSKAIIQLDQTLTQCNSDVIKQHPELFVAMRAGAIQAFEYTYELCVKMLRRQLQATEPSATEVTQMNYRDLLRLGAKRGYIDRPEDWFEFREHRNITSHTYDEDKADDVYEALPEFLKHAKSLLNVLEKNN